MLLSLCMIVKNEEDNLGRCLKSVKGLADEIIIVDTGSTDRTDEIAVSYGAHVYHSEWNNDFSEARNNSLSLAHGDWILVMDADDELEPGGFGKIHCLLQNAEKEELFCCKTLCYLGDHPDTGSVLINMNVRLIRNHRGYRFKGRIHEQISGCGDCPCIHAADICFYHYGYLKSQIEKKNKHKRNISLIRKELYDNPENAYMLFCMGNEYLATSKASSALGFYRKSLFLTPKQAGYRSALLVRMVLCCDRLRIEHELDGYLAEGIRAYPDLTDFLFLKACVLQRRKKLESAVRCFRKCIRLGDPPLGSNSTMGVSTFQAQYSIGVIYTQLGEAEKAIRCFQASIKSSPGFQDAWVKIIDLLISSGRAPDDIKNKLTALVPNNADSYRMLSNLFYDRRMYREALCFCRRAKRLEPENFEFLYDEAVCKFYLQQYGGASRCLARIKSGPYAAKASWYRLLCALLEKGEIPSFSKFNNQLDKTYYETARACLSLLYDEGSAGFAETDPRKYAAPIYSLLEILLACNETSAFQKSLVLLNSTADPSVHLWLGKLYYQYGYEKSAYSELIYSIRMTGQIDAEGLSILKNTYPPD